MIVHRFNRKSATKLLDSVRQRSFYGLALTLLLITQIMLGQSAFAQARLSGKVVTNTNAEPLIGVTIQLRSSDGGSTTGTTTDLEGNFEFNNLRENGIYQLEFSFIGFEPQKLTNQRPSSTPLQVVLVETVSKLGEVVVIGYGQTTKKDITGAVATLKAGDFNNGIINSPEQLLQGKVSGVNITSATGEPGGKQSITIRGPGGVRTGSTPLFVIDGMALDNSSTGGETNPLAFLNPNDIESMDVLKDASATAIYGARGANGVILITTKKGKSGHSSVNYSGSLGISTMARPIEVLGADAFRKEVSALGNSLIDEGGNTNWQKEVTRKAITQDHNISLAGGTNKFSYYGSLGVQQQEGILKNSNLNRYTGRINISQKMLKDRVTVDVNLNASNTKNERPPFQNIIGGALSANPTYPAYDANGEPFQYTDGTNPLITLALEKDLTTTNRVIGSISPSVNIGKGFVYKLNFGIDNSVSERDQQSLPNAQPYQEGRLVNINRRNTNRLIENYLTYTYDKGDHNLSALVGHSYQRFYIQERGWSINRFPTNGIDPIYNPGLGQDLTMANNKPYGNATENELQSYFSRATYQFKDRYLLTATVRIDGSSKFGTNNKYGTFPSFSAGWRISEEEFMKNSFVSDLKLRAGWGKTGNQEIPSKITQALFTSVVSGSSSYPLDNGSIYSPGTTYSRLANPNIQWENSTQTDIGLDFGFFQGALSGAIDYFDKTSRDILLEVIPADPVQPAGTYWTNVNAMRIRNRGVEFDLHYNKRVTEDFRYQVGGNITFIKNVVSNSPYSVITSGGAQGSGLSSATINGYINGHPIGSFFLREFTGFDEQGLSIYRDVDGDGISNDKDRIVAGSALPKIMYAFNGRVSWKGFDLAANFNGVSGNKVYDNTANSLFTKVRLSKSLNATQEAIEYPQESSNNSAPVSTRFLKDGSYLRLNNLALGYNLNTKRLGIDQWASSVRVSVTGTNLFVLTKYDGYDPEVNNDRSISGVTSYGIDYLSYPKARSIIFGINVGF